MRPTGPGEPDMAGRVRALDWSRTPVGPPRGWPQNLRTALDICLASRFPMLVWWGRELVQFYNDAFVPALGSKHPAALGQAAARCWAEIWPDVGPLAGHVLGGGGATFAEDQLLFPQRYGYVEETYWTFSYSPVRDDAGAVGGVFIAASETTARAIGERRLRILRELGELSTAAAGTAPDAVRVALAVLARHRADVPFALAYLRDDDGRARLVSTAGVVPGSAITAELLLPDRGHPISRVAAGGPAELCTGLGTGHRGSIEPGPVGDAPADDALVLPLSVAARPDPVGVLVLGVNPYRELDADHRSFFDLVARHVSTAVTDALAYQAERSRAEELAELDRAKTEFFTAVSHEFRTPLTLIMGPVEELRAAPALDQARLRAELEVVHRNGLRLGKLVDMLLDFSRLQEGRRHAAFEPVDLAAFTAELASLFGSAVERADLALTVDCPPLPEPAYVDRDMWERIVLNLLSNALKFTFEGGVTVAVGRDGGSAVLTVSDTGTGIPPGDLPRLFERFHRVRGARSRSGEGSGIGLALVQELVRLHGGTIIAESTLGAGTTFTVTLPLGVAHLPADQLVPPSEQPDAARASEPFVAEALRWLLDDQRPPDTVAPDAAGRLGSTRGRVQVVDDDPDMRGYLHRLLRPRYAVRSVADGTAALAAALDEPPDLILSDVLLPEVDGMALLETLRENTRTARVPVLLLSAMAGQEAAVEGLAAGADDYLVKPFSARELLARVGAHLELGRVRRQAEQRFAAMADLAPMMIWVSDARGSRVFTNQGWHRFTGRDGVAELGEGWQVGLHPRDRARYLAAVASAMAQREPWEIEFRLRRADGTYHWLLEHAAPIGPDADGYVGSCADIHARYRETERQTLLARVGAALAAETRADVRQTLLARLLVDTRLADVCTVHRVDAQGRLHRVAKAAARHESEGLLDRLDAETAIVGQVARTGRSVLVDGRTAAAEGTGLDACSSLAVPLSARGAVLGVVLLLRPPEASDYTDDDRMLADEIGVRAGLALDNALLLADERASAARLDRLQRATAALSAAATPQQVAVRAVGRFEQLLGVSAVGIWELRGTGRLEALTLDGWTPAARAQWTSLAVDALTAAGDAARRREPVWTERVEDWRRDHADQRELVRGFGYATVDAVPLLTGGACLGVVGLGFVHERVLSPAERAAAVALADQCAVALQRARLLQVESEARRTAERLTGMVGELSQARTPAQVARVILGSTAALGVERRENDSDSAPRRWQRMRSGSGH